MARELLRSCATISLPHLVLFPQVVQPLHIFEPRYCEMLKDAMEGDQLIAMALLESGWEKKFPQKPPVAQTFALAKSYQ